MPTSTTTTQQDPQNPCANQQKPKKTKKPSKPKQVNKTVSVRIVLQKRLIGEAHLIGAGAYYRTNLDIQAGKGVVNLFAQGNGSNPSSNNTVMPGYSVIAKPASIDKGSVNGVARGHAIFQITLKKLPGTKEENANANSTKTNGTTLENAVNVKGGGEAGISAIVQVDGEVESQNKLTNSQSTANTTGKYVTTNSPTGGTEATLTVRVFYKDNGAMAVQTDINGFDTLYFTIEGEIYIWKVDVLEVEDPH